MDYEFDDELTRKLVAAGFTDIRKVPGRIEVRRPEDYHPHIQMLWFDCYSWLPTVKPESDNWIPLESIHV